MSDNLLQNVARNVALGAAHAMEDSIGQGCDRRRYRWLTESLATLAEILKEPRCPKSESGWHILGPGMDAHVTRCVRCYEHFDDAIEKRAREIEAELAVKERDKIERFKDCERLTGDDLNTRIP